MAFILVPDILANIYAGFLFLEISILLSDKDLLNYKMESNKIQIACIKSI